MASFVPGQRWISEAEPELGLGTVVRVDGRRVEVAFPGAGERRIYAIAAAPLRRVRFSPGEIVADRAEGRLRVEEVGERDGILVYRGGGRELVESELAEGLSPSLPEQRLRAGRVDPPTAFDLRIEALRRRAEMRRAPTRGLVGGRIALLPHQLYIAEEVSSRRAPRVLLADEVGLGKTIEAGLILHRLLQTGRASRALVLVPPSLVPQWLVELLRRFQLWFRIFDEERCAAIERSRPLYNPFLDEQLVLAGLDLFERSAGRREQVVAAPWDVLVVDEAHRLGGGDDAPTPGYSLVAALAERTRAVLLLSATPEQLGRGSHFARLRLLDPQRYTERSAFEREAAGYAEVADLVERLLEGGPLRPDDRDSPLLAEPSGHLLARFDEAVRGEPGARERLVAEIVDRHGPGRVIFRNTREAVGGFPPRRPHLEELPPTPGPPDREPFDYARDPRLPWLAELVRSLARDKILLICRRREQVEALGSALARLIRVPSAVFHEALTLVQRDRNAAYFADPRGARLLLCSEIGSEGRNFQFCHHLVLFDLPEDPEVVEQRIGRLDRIGQRHAVEIHVPVPLGTSLEVRARWLDEGLDAFGQSLAGAHELHRRLGARVAALAARFDAGERDHVALAELIAASRREREEVAARLARGRDRLLERSSFDRRRAATLVERIRAVDEDAALEDFLLRLLERSGVRIEETGERTYLLEAEDVASGTLPGLGARRVHATFSRETALAREDLAFLTWDHPLVTAAIEALLGSETGNASVAWLPDGGPTSLLLEASFVLECVARAALGADRFLPPSPIRVVVDERLGDQSASFPAEELARRLRRTPSRSPGAADSAGLGRIGAMLAAARERAEREARTLIEEATSRMREALGAELERLEILAATGGRVLPDEIELIRGEIADLAEALAASRLRLDALRLIRCEPGERRGASLRPG